MPVIKGIQVGAGLSLVISAGNSLLLPLGLTTPNWADNLLWALFAFLALLFNQKFSRFPYALVFFTIGVIFSMCITGFTHLPSLTLWRPKITTPSWTSFRSGALEAGLGQIPLTTLNSVIAVSFLSSDLFPQLPGPTVTALGISVGLMNLTGGWFGAMPVCHGSGGLAAQYRFGARSGASIIILGLLKILLGLVFGESLVVLLHEYPKSLLGVMVLAAGLELAGVGESLNYDARDLWEHLDADETLDAREERPRTRRLLSAKERIQRWNVMLMTIGGLLAFKNDAVGFAAGMLCHWSYQVPNLHIRLGSGQGIIRRRKAATRGEEERLLPNA
jgi:Molybdate transporter of MFS superfamily